MAGQGRQASEDERERGFEVLMDVGSSHKGGKWLERCIWVDNNGKGKKPCGLKM